MFFTLQYATGLSIYFVLSSVIRIAQYYLVQRDRGGGKAGGKGLGRLKQLWLKQPKG
jgi:hypothetical protein